MAQKFYLKFLLFILSCTVILSLQSQTSFHWSEWATLPHNPELESRGGQNGQPGLAGAYSGTSGDVIIIAGGANFPYAKPWDGGEKHYWDQIYVIEIDKNGSPQSLVSDQKLPVPMGYGGVVQNGDEVILVGGENQEGIVDDVIGIRWDPVIRDVKIRKLSPLPNGFQAGGADLIDGRLMVHGLQDGANALLHQDMTGQWEVLPPCPGPPRYFPVTQAQSNGRVQGFYLFSGRSQDKSGNVSLLYDGYMYDHVQKTWILLGLIGRSEEIPLCVMGAASVRSGASHIIVFGGDDGVELRERVKISKQLSRGGKEIDSVKLSRDLDSLFVHHSGFSNVIRAYHTITNTWTTLDTFSAELPVTTQAFTHDGQFYLTSGEIHPGVRTPVIWKGLEIDEKEHFGWLNYTVIVLYFLVLVLIGLKYSRRQKTTDDYFKGGGRIPWWAAGLSLFGTSLSAITFMAIPAKTYMTDWGYFFFQMTPLLVAPILIALYIPYFRGLNITSAYEYLEKRFNLLTRILGSLSFMILQLGRVGIVLFLPSIAVSLVTGVSIELCIVVIGLVSIVYTMLGGIEAVIWTDVIQVVILMGGAFLCLIFMFYQIDLTAEEAFEKLVHDDKFRILDTAFDFSKPTIWVVLVGGIFANLITSGSDQTMVQRYLTTSDQNEANRSVWTFALLAIPATLIFFTIGTALYLYYHGHADHLNPSLANEDAIFPWYIVNELPAGISGLLIAGIFSAAMSTLSSSMNSVSTAFITDFYQRFSWSVPRGELWMARMVTLVFGIVGTVFALMMASWNIQSLWDQFQLYVGLFAGGLGGLFLLGMTTRRANGRGAILGLICSAIIQYFLTYYTHMHVLLFAATGFVSCYVLSYLFSLIWPSSRMKG